MVNLIHAEYIKAINNRSVTFFALGALPILTIGLLNILVVLALLGLWQPEFEAINWQEQIILASGFANQALTMVLFIIFAGVIFGSEYTWQTYKSIVPRTHRYKIVLSKLCLIALAIFFVTQIMSTMVWIGSWELATVVSIPLVHDDWSATGISFLAKYGWMSFAIFCNFMIGVIYTSIATISTRSTVAGIGIGIAIAIADTFGRNALNLIIEATGINALAWLGYPLPNYHIQNINSWVLTGATLPNYSLGVSVIIFISWIVVGTAISTHLFQRQDIH